MRSLAEMTGCRHLLLLLVFVCLVGALHASEGDEDPIYSTCVAECDRTGDLGGSFIQHCLDSSNSEPVNGTWHKLDSLYLWWKQWNCKSDCHYHCMMRAEKSIGFFGQWPLVKYHGRWPFKRVSVFQEPVSAVLSALNLVVQFAGWLSFFFLSHYKLPIRPQSKRTYYEFTLLWHFYGVLSMNAWFWSAIFHTQASDLAEKLVYSSAVALLGYSLIVAILRTFSVKDEAARVMVAAPLLAFLSTHILYLNFYKLDHGLNMKVCIALGVTQILLWVGWAAVTRHPSKYKLWTVAIGCAIGMVVEISDFPPFNGYVGSHALWYATTIPLSYLWWSFVKEDADFRTSALLKKSRNWLSCKFYADVCPLICPFLGKSEFGRLFLVLEESLVRHLL